MSGFTYFGEELTYADEFPSFEFAEFQEALAEDEVDNNRATGVALRLAVACVAEEDRGRFRKLSRQNRAKVEDWLRVFRDYASEEAERPTGQPSDSSTGPAATPESSASPPATSDSSEDDKVRPIRGDLALALSRSA